jgi:hypothetical protein
LCAWRCCVQGSGAPAVCRSALTTCHWRRQGSPFHGCPPGGAWGSAPSQPKPSAFVCSGQQLEQDDLGLAAATAVTGTQEDPWAVFLEQPVSLLGRQRTRRKDCKIEYIVASQVSVHSSGWLGRLLGLRIVASHRCVSAPDGVSINDRSERAFSQFGYRPYVKCQISIAPEHPDLSSGNGSVGDRRPARGEDRGPTSQLGMEVNTWPSSITLGVAGVRAALAVSMGALRLRKVTELSLFAIPKVRSDLS